MSPVLASRHKSERSEASRLEVCRKMRSPQTIGLPLPSPGIRAIQRASSLVNLTGMFLSSDTPVPLGPRKRSQLSARALETDRITATARDVSRNRVEERG